MFEFEAQLLPADFYVLVCRFFFHCIIADSAKIIKVKKNKYNLKQILIYDRRYAILSFIKTFSENVFINTILIEMMKTAPFAKGKQFGSKSRKISKR